MSQVEPKKKKIKKEFEISNDELSHIISYLDFGSILNLCCVNKEMYQNIEKIAKNKTPEVIKDPWTLKKAFSQQILTIASKEDLLIFQKKKHIIEGLILESILIPEGNFLISLLYLRDPKENQNLKKRSKHSDQEIFISKSQFQELTNLKMIYFRSTNSVEDYEFIFYIPNLEEIIFSELSMLNFKQLAFDFKDKMITTVKRITYSSIGELISNLVQFLNIFPNLEHVKFVTDTVFKNEQFLKLSKFRNLKSIWVEFYDKGIKFEGISDQVFSQVVNSLKNLEEITFKCFHSINGSFFTMIRNPRLRKMDLSRRKECIEEIEEYDFQNYLEHLKELILENFDNEKILHSIMKYCPNISKLTIMNSSREKYQKFEEFLIKNISHERVDIFDTFRLNEMDKDDILEKYAVKFSLEFENNDNLDLKL